MILENIFSAQFVYSILRMATPLVLSAMAALITKKAGVMCIAFEGMMLFGALGGVIGSAFTQNVFAGVLTGILFGVAVAFIFAYFVLVLHANTVLTGLALNTLGSGGTVFILYVICGDKGTSTSLNSLVLPSVNIPLVEQIPVLGPILSGHNVMTYLAFLAVIVTYLFINKTSMGLRIRSVGENPQAAESVGIKVVRTRFTARCRAPLGNWVSSMTVCWASRREEASAVVTTTARSAAQVASRKPLPRPAGASRRQ